jgi:hypothetical protein
MAFERYLGQRSNVNKPRVSVWKTGQIGLNGAVLHELGLEKKTYASLFYDRAKKKIGLRFSDSAKEEGAVKLVRRGGGAVVFARGFLRYFKIDHSRARRFKLVFDEKQSLHVLEPE